jgi:hypothetical protein
VTLSPETENRAMWAGIHAKLDHAEGLVRDERAVIEIVSKWVEHSPQLWWSPAILHALDMIGDTEDTLLQTLHDVQSDDPEYIPF